MLTREWGEGRVLIALHPLGLEAAAFAGLGTRLANCGIHTIAADLPGFGQTPGPQGPLTPACLAEPVIELARGMESPPAILGYSMGGRVALEATLEAPELFGSVILIAPYLPWLRLRRLMPLARLMSPTLAEKIPVEMLWPLLRRLAYELENLPILRDDDVAQAGARLIYYMACPATRRSLVSAAREMALDPALGPEGLWTRLADLHVPAAFLWGQQDWLVPSRFAYRVAQVLPSARQIRLPCLQHAMNGPHTECLAELVDALLQGRVVETLLESDEDEGPLETAACRVDESINQRWEVPG